MRGVHGRARRRSGPELRRPVGRVGDGARIESAASVAAEPAGRAVVAALTEADALQCGFCAPGITVTCAVALREHGSLAAEPAQLRELLASHVCRCTGYLPLVEALAGLALDHDDAGSRA